MKNHSKDPNYKEFLALQRRRGELLEARWKNRIKLDEPYHRGYDHFLVPRYDIQIRSTSSRDQVVVNEYSNQIDISGLASGMYIIATQAEARYFVIHN